MSDCNGKCKKDESHSNREKEPKIDLFLRLFKVCIPYAVYIFGTLVLLLYGIVMGGSTSNSTGIASLYLVNVHNLNATAGRDVANSKDATYYAADVSVRIGYFGKPYFSRTQEQDLIYCSRNVYLKSI